MVEQDGILPDKGWGKTFPPFLEGMTILNGTPRAAIKLTTVGPFR